MDCGGKFSGWQPRISRAACPQTRKDSERPSQIRALRGKLMPFLAYHLHSKAAGAVDEAAARTAGPAPAVNRRREDLNARQRAVRRGPLSSGCRGAAGCAPSPSGSVPCVCLRLAKQLGPGCRGAMAVDSDGRAGSVRFFSKPAGNKNPDSALSGKVLQASGI